MKRRFFSVVLSAVILALASMGITASAAETAATEPTTAETSAIEETTDKSESADDAPVTETPAEIDADEFMKYITDNENADDSRPDYYGDDYYDTNGNATLIKSEHIIYNTEEMQFIAVTTKDGHVFYVLINYSAESGEDNVYFLNKVDAVDLYSLIYMTDEEKENGIDMNNVEKAENAAVNAFGKEKPNAENSDNSESTDNSDSDTAEQKQPVNKPMSANNLYLIIGVVSILGIGGAGFFLMKKKPAKKAVPEMDDDEEINFYDDSEINEDEE
ncbi:MAG: DUF4366 domain-containing protein [Ruminococcus sp.]|nr:DUF4366 domain-containing protein [Ruminococcus sp.]